MTPQSSPQWLQDLLNRNPLPELSPRHSFNPAWDAEIARLHEALASELGNRAIGLTAGLYLMNGNLDKAHDLAQDLPDATGSYWHGLMHRMEPDYDNARYWFRRVGDHPAFADVWAGLAELPAAHPQLDREFDASFGALRRWDPFRMIDAVEQAAASRSAAAELLKLVQWVEMNRLLQFVNRSLENRLTLR